jgi:plastocyanin
MFNRRPLLALSCAALTAIALLTACGDDDDGREPAITATPSGGGTITVQAQDNNYSETELEATAGDEVTIVLDNRGANQHTLTMYTDAQYSQQLAEAGSGIVAGGANSSFDFTFDAGTYFFRCEVHPTQMEGTLTAE